MAVKPRRAYYKPPHLRKRDAARAIFIELVSKHPDPVAQAKKLGYDWLIKAIRQLKETPGVYGPLECYRGKSPRKTTIVIEIEHYPDTTWSEVKQGVLAEAKRQFYAIREQMRSEANLGQRDRYPEDCELERNVKFLYQHVCLGLGPLGIWNELEQRDEGAGLTYETLRVRKRISSLAVSRNVAGVQALACLQANKRPEGRTPAGSYIFTDPKGHYQRHGAIIRNCTVGT